MRVELLAAPSVQIPPILIAAKGYRTAILATCDEVEAIFGERPQRLIVESDDEGRRLLAEVMNLQGVEVIGRTYGQIMRDVFNVSEVLVRLA